MKIVVAECAVLVSTPARLIPGAYLHISTLILQANMLFVKFANTFSYLETSKLTYEQEVHFLKKCVYST